MFKNPFSFKGRIRRTEHLISFLVYFAIYGGVFAALAAGITLVGIVMIPLTWFLWAQNAKRCHDRGNTGWYQLIPFYVLILFFLDSEPGSNQYGPNPKEKAPNDYPEVLDNSLIEK